MTQPEKPLPQVSRRANAKTRFRAFRWSRPFWAGLWILSGGAVMAWLPLGPITDIVRAGSGAVVGVFLGLGLIVAGFVVWFVPDYRKLAAVCAIALGLVSFPVTNLGGFVAGMLLAIVGGSMAFAWVSDKPHTSKVTVSA